MNTSLLRPLRAILSFFLLAAILWVAFGPLQIGGPVSYVIINGNSMEPDFSLGDLVLARKSGLYRIDDRVVYNHPQVGYIFHRVVGEEADGFVLKGDNNHWLDSFHPGPEDILGKYWFSIPGAGSAVRFLRQPDIFAGLIGIIFLLIFVMFFLPGKSANLGRKGKQIRMSERNLSPQSTDYRQELLLSLALILLAAVIFGLIAFTKPLKITISDDISFQHQSDFSYSASDAGGIYDSSGVQTGDPIYPMLTCQMDLTYAYQLSSLSYRPGEAEGIEGTFQLTARLSDADGWKRTITLVPESGFSGRKVRTQSSLNICDLLRLIEEKELVTGTDIRWYSLTISPEITVRGEIQGVSLEDTYLPEFQFSLGDNVLRLPDGVEEFDQDQEGALPNSRDVENSLTFFGRSLKVNTARWIAVSIVVVSCLGAIYPAVSIYREWNKSLASRIRIENQPLLVDLQPGNLKCEGRLIIDVASFQDLRKMAERYGSLILHEVDQGVHHYMILEGDFCYQFSMENAFQDFDLNEVEENGASSDL